MTIDGSTYVSDTRLAIVDVIEKSTKNKNNLLTRHSFKPHILYYFRENDYHLSIVIIFLEMQDYG